MLELNNDEVEFKVEYMEGGELDVEYNVKTENAEQCLNTAFHLSQHPGDGSSYVKHLISLATDEILERWGMSHHEDVEADEPHKASEEDLAEFMQEVFTAKINEQLKSATKQ